MKSIYFDYAATTPVDPIVLRAMLPYFSKIYGNTMSLHEFGRHAHEAVEKSRSTIARIINAETSEIYFTGSATESNNLALKGVALANRHRGNHLIISAIEHDCVLESARYLSRNGYAVTILPVDKYGLVNIEELESLINEKTILISIIHGNNEVGTLQDLEKIGRICRNKKVYFHTDASQSYAKELIDVKKMNIDLLTASSHKIYGPKGAACLFVRKSVLIDPILHGGGHENKLRSSTLNVPAIIGFAKAAEITVKSRNTENQRLLKLRDKLISGILGNIKDTYLNGHPTKRLANNINISFPFVEGESLVMQLDFAGIACSTGSACSSTTLEPSHVLIALGLPPQGAHGSLRISLGRWTKESDINYLLKVLPAIVKKFRRISPFKN